MNEPFIAEIVEEERPPRIVGTLSGWESIVFVVEDECPSLDDGATDN